MDDSYFSVVRVCDWHKMGLADDVNNLNCSEENSYVDKQLHVEYNKKFIDRLRIYVLASVKCRIHKQGAAPPNASFLLSFFCLHDSALYFVCMTQHLSGCTLTHSLELCYPLFTEVLPPHHLSSNFA